jgi:spermidine/putrescine transport system permease protein
MTGSPDLAGPASRTGGDRARLRANARRWRFFLVFSPPFLWTALFLIVPYAVMFAVSFYERQFPLFVPAFQFDNYVLIFSDRQYSLVLLRTLKIAIIVSAASLMLAYPVAYYLAFCIRSARIRMLLYMAVIVPLWVSYLLRAYIWKTILGTSGVLNSFLLSAGILSEPTDVFLYNQFSMAITLTYIFIPFMVMPIYASLEKIPASLIEASHDLGVGPFRTFLKVILPMSTNGIVAGLTLTFCLCFGDFVAASLVGGPNGAMVANVLQSQFGAALNWPLGAALSTVIMLIVLFVLFLSDRFERTERISLG